VSTALAGLAVLVAVLASGALGAGAFFFCAAARARARRKATSASTMPRTQSVRPRDKWRATELAHYKGINDGPILLAADGIVFEVGSARRLYGPTGEYACMAGGDASRLLAKQRLEPESLAEAAVPLSLAERAVLQAWVLFLKRKYAVVGRLASPAEDAAMAAAEARREVYLERLEEMSVCEAEREALERSLSCPKGEVAAAQVGPNGEHA